MGMSVFAGLRYVVWGEGDMTPNEVTAGVNRLLAEGLLRRCTLALPMRLARR